MEITKDMVIRTLANWGWNEGEFEEVIVELAQNADEMIETTDAKIYDDMISYTLALTEKGVETHGKWCQKHEYTPNLKGKKKNILLFVDDDFSESIKNTLEEWGL